MDDKEGTNVICRCLVDGMLAVCGGNESPENKGRSLCGLFTWSILNHALRQKASRAWVILA